MSAKPTIIPRRDVAVPHYMHGLVRDERGYIVPRFVAFLQDRKLAPYGSLGATPDFRAIDTKFMIRAVKGNLCWLCGQSLGRYHIFVIGPMCMVNRITSEPGCHFACAEYAVKVCPFMINPRTRRNEKPTAADHVKVDPAGIHNDRNPGAYVLWGQVGPAKPFEVKVGSGGVLFKLANKPDSVQWWTQGRKANRDEALAALDAGVEELGKLDNDVAARRDLMLAAAEAKQFLPRA